MLDHNPNLDTLASTDIAQLTLPPPLSKRSDCRFASSQFLAPLHQAMASWRRCSHQGGNQIIVRFNNGYGAIISEYRMLEGIFEIAPLRFHGPGPDDHEFYFRSHVPDLTWCSDHTEMLRVCEQIARLQPTSAV
jgi:hypothetical protein